MRLTGLLVVVMLFVGGGCRYTDDLPVEGRSFFMYGEIGTSTELQIESILAVRGGTVATHLNEETSVVIRGNEPAGVTPIEKTVSEDEAITQWAINETASNHFQHLEQRAEKLGVEVMTPQRFLNLARREEVDWMKVLRLGFGD
ncbi:MAG: hypothetical protein RIG82_07710 [Phycisphaeraceae bacterium]